MWSVMKQQYFSVIFSDWLSFSLLLPTDTNSGHPQSHQTHLYKIELGVNHILMIINSRSLDFLFHWFHVYAISESKGLNSCSSALPSEINQPGRAETTWGTLGGVIRNLQHMDEKQLKQERYAKSFQKLNYWYIYYITFKELLDCLGINTIFFKKKCI